GRENPIGLVPGGTPRQAPRRGAPRRRVPSARTHSGRAVHQVLSSWSDPAGQRVHGDTGYSRCPTLEIPEGEGRIGGELHNRSRHEGPGGALEPVSADQRRRTGHDEDEGRRADEKLRTKAMTCGRASTEKDRSEGHD